MTGDYFQMLNEVFAVSERRKVILFLGGNIGNTLMQDAIEFCTHLHALLNIGDILIAGFDLIKNPLITKRAYDDEWGTFN